MRVVIDTNVIISRYWSPRGIASRVLGLLERNAFELVLSSDILAEYHRVLCYRDTQAFHRMSDTEIDRALDELIGVSLVVEPTERLAVIEDDPDDDKFLECAVAAHAHYIVSGNKHLLRLGSFRGIQILPPALFLSLFDPSATEP
ncbi:MAG: putative toxin-antitoxin system toxin component, PIN family [Thermomicrobiales bacterium]